MASCEECAIAVGHTHFQNKTQALSPPFGPTGEHVLHQGTHQIKNENLVARCPT